MIYCANTYCHGGTFENLQNIDETHFNKDIWAFAYQEDDRAINYMCKPVKGKIVKGRFNECFYEYKKNDKDLKSRGVNIYARYFADTYEEAVYGFNILVQSRIDSLTKEIGRLQDMLIKNEK